MKITIDTSVDSKEDIRKAAALLASLADGRHERHSNIFDDSSPGLGISDSSDSDSAAGNAFASMFGDNTVQAEEKKEEEKEEIPEIIEY